VRALLAAALVGAVLATGLAARADQAAILDRATALRAAARLAAGTEVVLWTRLPEDAEDTAPPVLYRVRETTLSRTPDGWVVRLLARRLAAVVDGAWSIATWGPAERLELDLAYAYAPAAGEPSAYTNLAAELGLRPEVASTRIAVDPAVLTATAVRRP